MPQKSLLDFANELQSYLDDTTQGEWRSYDTKLLIKTISGKFDTYDLQSRGDAAFIEYAKNHAQEVIDIINDNYIETTIAMPDDNEPVLTRQTDDDFLDELARRRGEL